MTHTHNPISRLQETPQPYPGAPPDSDRGKRPPLGQSWRWSDVPGAPCPIWKIGRLYRQDDSRSLGVYIPMRADAHIHGIGEFLAKLVGIFETKEAEIAKASAITRLIESTGDARP